ncbi:DUF2795 domain-containing protein [Streptomyces nogalater]
MVSAARRAGATEEVVKALRGMPAEEYAGRAEVARSVRVDPDSDLGPDAAGGPDRPGAAASRASPSTCGKSRRHPSTRSSTAEPAPGTAEGALTASRAPPSVTHPSEQAGQEAR